MAPLPTTAALVGVLAFAPTGCTIIVEPPEPAPGATFLVPFSCLPVAVNPVTGAPQLFEGGPLRTAQVIFTARIERSTVNLASTYGVFMQEAVVGLATLGVHVTHAALLRLDERPVRPVLAAWGCDLDDPQALRPEQVIEHYALAAPPPSQPLGCATDPVVDAGARLTELVTDYPEGLPGRSGRTVFSEAPYLLLVVHLDPLARRVGIDEPPCARATALAENRDGLAGWLAYGGGGIPLDRVVHWFVYTDEGIDDETLAARCRAVEGFPLGAFDALAASPRVLYGPLAEAIRRGGQRVSTLSMCRFLVENGRQGFLLEALQTLAADLGLSFNPNLLLTLLEGDFAGPPEAPEPGGDDG